MKPGNQSHSLQISAVILWATIQLMTLGIAALGLPLWAHHPAPREALAVHEMVAVQIGAMALLFPFLLPNVATTTAAIALALPFTELAGLLSCTPQATLLNANVFVTIWIIGLGCCLQFLASDEKRQVAVAVAALMSIGGAVLWYFHLEAVVNSGTADTSQAYGPVLAAVSMIDESRLHPIAWVEVAIPMLIALVLAIISRQVIHRFVHEESTAPLKTP